MRGREGTDWEERKPSELIYFKVYKSQIPGIEQAIEMAAPMPGTDKSRGYCLEMICADFLAGAHLVYFAWSRGHVPRRKCSSSPASPSLKHHDFGDLTNRPTPASA